MTEITLEQFKGTNIEKGFKSESNPTIQDIEKALECNLEKGLISEELYDKAVEELDLLKGKKAMVGEIRDWKGKKYKKIANGKWAEISEHGYTHKEHSQIVKNYDIALGRPMENTESALEYNNELRKQKAKHQAATLDLDEKEYTDEEMGVDNIHNTHDIEYNDVEGGYGSNIVAAKNKITGETFTHHKDPKTGVEGYEYYTGENYGGSGRSYSRNYKKGEYPKKHEKIYKQLEELHKEKYSNNDKS